MVQTIFVSPPCDRYQELWGLFMLVFLGWKYRRIGSFDNNGVKLMRPHTAHISNGQVHRAGIRVDEMCTAYAKKSIMMKYSRY